MTAASVKADVGLVVLSCDKYSDLWKPFFELFFRFWPDCPFPVYLFVNESSFDHPKVRTIGSGSDPDWSTSVKRCLTQLEHRHVWLFFDDIFLDRQVEPQGILRLIDFILDKNPDYLRFRRFPKPEEKINADFGRCVEGRPYRTSVFGIWRRTTLIDLLREGESAWAFEQNSVQRANKYSQFYGVYEDYFSYIHGVEKGMWTKPAVRQMAALGYSVDLSRRSVMSEQQHIGYLRASFRTFIFNRTPSRFKSVLLQASAVKRKLFVKR